MFICDPTLVFDIGICRRGVFIQMICGSFSERHQQALVQIKQEILSERRLKQQHVIKPPSPLPPAARIFFSCCANHSLHLHRPQAMVGRNSKCPQDVSGLQMRFVFAASVVA
jgi:hypothetical protein